MTLLLLFASAPQVGVITGSSNVAFSTSGALTGTGALSGASSPAFTTTGILKGLAPIAGATSVTFAPAGILKGSGRLIGATSLTFTLSGLLTGPGISGSLSFGFSLSASLSDGRRPTFDMSALQAASMTSSVSTGNAMTQTIRRGATFSPRLGN